MIGFVRAVATALKGIVTDPGAKSTMIISILIYAVLYPQPYLNEVVRDVPIVAVDQDNSTASRNLLRLIDASEGAKVAAAAPDLPTAREYFFDRKAFGVVLVPKGFEADLIAGRASPIAAYGDASYFLVYSSIMTAITGSARAVGADVQMSRLLGSGTDPQIAATLISPMNVTGIALFNPQGGYASYVVPAAFALILQQTLLMGIGILHAGRAPLRGIAIAATPIAYVILYLLWVAFTQLALPALYHIPRLGDVATLMAVAIPFLLAVTAMGFAIAMAIPSREGVIYFLVVLGMPLFFMSGISWPAEAMPQPLVMLAQLIPSSSAIRAIVSVDQMGSSIDDVLPTIGLQLALATGYFGLALLIGSRKAEAL